MAISLKTTPAWTGAITATPQSFTIPTSPAPAAGDRMFLWSLWKNYDVNVATDPSGWIKIAEYADGSVAGGAGTGSLKVACWYRDWQSGDANPSVSWSAAPSIAAGLVQIF